MTSILDCPPDVVEGPGPLKVQCAMSWSEEDEAGLLRGINGFLEEIAPSADLWPETRRLNGEDAWWWRTHERTRPIAPLDEPLDPYRVARGYKAPAHVAVCLIRRWRGSYHYRLGGTIVFDNDVVPNRRRRLVVEGVRNEVGQTMMVQGDGNLRFEGEVYLNFSDVRLYIEAVPE